MDVFSAKMYVIEPDTNFKCYDPMETSESRGEVRKRVDSEKSLSQILQLKS